MSDNVKGKLAGDWDWNLERHDKGTSWVGTISKGGGHAFWLTYEHGVSIAESSARADSPFYREIEAEKLREALWPMVEDYLLSLESR